MWNDWVFVKANTEIKAEAMICNLRLKKKNELNSNMRDFKEV